MRVYACYSWWSASPRRLGGDQGFGDHLMEIMDSPTQGVNSSGWIIVLKWRWINPYRALDLCIGQGWAKPLCGCWSLAFDYYRISKTMQHMLLNHKLLSSIIPFFEGYFKRENKGLRCMHINKGEMQAIKSKACYSSGHSHISFHSLQYIEQLQTYLWLCTRTGSKVPSNIEHNEALSSRNKIMHGTVPLFIEERYNFVWNYKYAYKAYTHALQTSYVQHCFPPLFVLNKTSGSSSLLRKSRSSATKLLVSAHAFTTSMYMRSSTTSLF
jgi:hypothetical protein